MSLKSSENESSLLYSQAKNLFEKAKISIDDGSLNTQGQLVYEVFQAFNAFFESVGKPNMIVRLAPEGGPPWSEDFNDMMDEIKEDLEMLYAEVELIGQTLYTDFNHNTVQYEMLNTKFNDVLDSMKDLELYSGVTNSTIQYANEEFLNTEKIDFSRSTISSADVFNGVASLPIKEKVNVSPEASVTIVTGNVETNDYIIGSASNGFPGNNTEVQTVTDGILTSQRYTPTFIGEQDNHGNYETVIDDNANTWFEYEKISIREHDKVNVAKNIGWNYLVSGSTMVEYVGEPKGGSLKLQMQIILEEEKVINQISLNMYTPPNYGAKTAKIKDILVSDGRIPAKGILPPSYKGEGYNFNFDPVNAKVIYILFEQPEKYATDIGHIYYEKTSQSQRTGDYALGNDINATKYSQRVEGPAISLDALGVIVSQNNTKLETTYPSRRIENGSKILISEMLYNLSTSIEDVEIDIGTEKFEGWRWCIGVRDINIYSCVYENEGEIVSKPYNFDKAIEKITLSSEEILPASILENYETKYEHIKYYISIDDGANWNPITPMDHEIISEEQPPKVYTIRTADTDTMKLTNKNSYLESSSKVYNVRVKVVLVKPIIIKGLTTVDVETESLTDKISPVLESYTLNVVTEGNVFDSAESYRIITASDINNSIGELEGSLDIPDPNVDEIIEKETNGACDPDDPDSECYAPIDENGESSGGSDKLQIEVFDNPIERKRFCLGKDTLIKGTYSGNFNIDRLELLINGVLIEVTEIFNTLGSVRGGNFSFNVTSAMLEKYIKATARGNNFNLYVYVYDVNGNTRRSHITSVFVDCEAQEKEERKLSVQISEMNNKICYCNDLHIKGYAKSNYLLEKNSIRLEINNKELDFNNMGTPKVNPCIPEDDTIDELSSSIIPDLIPDARVPVEQMDKFEGIVMYESQGANASEVEQVELCVNKEITEKEFYLRISTNHPIKKIVLRVNGNVKEIDEYKINSGVFDSIYAITLSDLTDKKEYKISIAGEFFLGYEDRAKGFSFNDINLVAKLSDTECEDSYGSVDGESNIKPSNFYDLESMDYEDPYYADYDSEIYANSIKMYANESEEVFKVQATTNKVVVTPELVSFDITIPYWKLLELGCETLGKYKVKVYAKDVMSETSESYVITMSDCVGDPKDDNEIEWVKEEVSCVVCDCDSLVIKGYMNSKSLIKNVQLFVNGTEVDPTKIIEPSVNKCSTIVPKSKVTVNPVDIMGDTLSRTAIEYYIPYWKLVELGCSPGNTYKIRLKGITEIDTTTSIYSFEMKTDCEDGSNPIGDCTICENGECDNETDTIDINILEITNRPCECEDVIIKGQISSSQEMLNEVELRINDMLINPYDLGEVYPSKCVSTMGVDNKVSAASYELLQKTTYHEFEWVIPYWKLLQVGCNLRGSYPLKITAFAKDGELRKEYKKKLSLKDCTTPKDEPAYDDACHTTESVIINYYHAGEQVMKEEIIPVGLLPYQIDNGAGSVARICIRDKGSKGVAVEMIASGDESNYAFQLFAVGLNYYNFDEQDDLRTTWAQSVFTSLEVTNPTMMLKSPVDKTNNWLNDVRIGRYEKAPSLNKEGSLIHFNMDAYFKKYKCKENIECGIRKEPMPTGKACNQVTHFIVQNYDIQSKALVTTKIQAAHVYNSNGEYQLDSKTKIRIAWHEEFQGIAIEVVESENAKSAILTAVGLVYIDPDGKGHTAWSERLRFYTHDANEPKLILGKRKEIKDLLLWLSGTTIDYSRAPYIGGKGSIIVLKVDEDISNNICSLVNQPVITVPHELAYPTVKYPDLKICENYGTIPINLVATDYTGVDYVIYSVMINGENRIIDSVLRELNKTFSEPFVIELNTNELLTGDNIEISIRLENILEGQEILNHTYTVEYCDTLPPEILDFSVSSELGKDPFCYNKLIDEEFISLSVDVKEDRALASYSILWNGAPIGGETFDTSDLITSTEGSVIDVPLVIPGKTIDPITEFSPTLMADIVFVIDTGSTMARNLNKLEAGIDLIKNTLYLNKIHARFAYVDSLFESTPMNTDFVSSEEFNLSSVVSNNGSWATLNWEQFVNEEQGAMYFLDKFRENTKRIFIAVTDSIIESVQDEAADESDYQVKKNKMISNGITTYFMTSDSVSENEDYLDLMSLTNGKRFTLENEEFVGDYTGLADTIVNDMRSYRPDKTYTLQLQAIDWVGHTASRDLTFSLTNCFQNEIKEEISSDEKDIPME